METEPITVLCLLCAISKRVKHKRDECKDNISRHAEKMIDASVKRFKQAEICDIYAKYHLIFKYILLVIKHGVVCT